MNTRPRFPEKDIRLTIRSLHKPGSLGNLLTVIGSTGALVGDISTQFVGRDTSMRQITVQVYDAEHLERLKEAVKLCTTAEILEVNDLVYERHEGGKIQTIHRHALHTVEDLRYVYTPGVARICQVIKDDPGQARRFTGLGTTIGIYTNGTRVLGLGDIGPLASLPVMEGKSMLYSQFAGISAVPVLVDTKDPKEFVETVLRSSVGFGGIHLEDIRTPDCFEIESELIARLDKPVMHDDQHGTATVLLAAVFSVFRNLGLGDGSGLTFAQLGLGAAGYGIAKLLIDCGYTVIGSDPSADARKRLENYGGMTGDLTTCMEKADIVIATTGVVGLIQPSMIRKGQVILSLSNPVPEIFPEDALDAGAAFASDGKSINNALAFPGLFRAALQTGSREISSAMKIAAAKAISGLASQGELVPNPLDRMVHDLVTAAVVHEVSGS